MKRVALAIVWASASAVAAPEARKPTKAEATARRWLATMVASKDGLVSATAARPIVYASDTGCSKAGTATNAADTRGIKACLRSSVRGDLLEAREASPQSLAKLIPADVLAAMKDTTLVRAMYNGPSGDGTIVFLGVAGDDSIRALWLHFEWLE